MQPIVDARGVTKSFGRGETRTTVLHGIDFTVMPGEITFIIGPSGCGKTTLVSVLAGMLKAEEGEVSLFGERIDRMRGGRLTRFRGRSVGFIFQQFNLIPALDAAENAGVPLVVAGERPSVARRKGVALLEKLGLGKQAGKLPSQLSGGQQQRVAIARALIHQPGLLICDEPTASLDAKSGQAVMELLRELAASDNRAVIVVTHDDRIYPFADRIVEMSDGRIVDDRRTARTAP
ncbi:putative ABC transport system ATP-binding protein [Devosia enhydra]|uniref:Putative ABC transport system ATP-binding protein n=1 Tax=Devosia enhydra TaxID=665118 RepID=A0A1K2HWH4_9HYPH|nr:ABC transporter ATP-binding protein [Devosia enhydra]SFZ83322.1 putative ABC transport system ATP-binding protein [Devosia enhydra]